MTLVGDAAVLFLTGAGTGLLAGGASCAAVQLGLLAGAVRGTARPAVPVAAFLAAKLAAHTALGALLGLAGAAVQPGPRVRAALLLAAAAVLIVFALDLLGFAPARRLVRRSGGAGAEHCPAAPPRVRGPALLGAATVLVPCGVTLSAELLAVTSRSPVAGAAVMAGFVLGTVPVAALVGLGVGRGMAVLRGRLTAAVGVALVAVAGWTVLSGLRLGGWLPEPAGAATAGNVTAGPGGTQVITIGAADRGYRPALVAARSGVRTVLVVRTHGNRGCTRAFTIPARGLERTLPETGDTRLDLGVPVPGRLRFTCASGHYPGTITFR
ncbi:sulfite exporter TauE/SafE family protein [Spirillospora sp. NPDC029432]|uniref:urease accessory protein UreH domain-containing protein n=1 Tax=Spirillospora sp. NPDC029432 TaxID=3154599 RepID=UPI00345641F8